jgi:hypothetical protein
VSQDIRTKLHAAFTFVRSVEANRATASLTLDHLIQEQISSLKKGELRAVRDGVGTVIDNRISRWDQLETLQKDMEAVVSAIRGAKEDPDTLRRLGIFEVDAETKSDESPSSNVEGALL